MPAFSKLYSLGEDWNAILSKYKTDNEYVPEFKCFKKDLRYKGHEKVIKYKSTDFKNCKSAFIDKLNQDIVSSIYEEEPALLINFEDYDLKDILDFLGFMFTPDGKIKEGSSFANLCKQNEKFISFCSNDVSKYQVNSSIYVKEENMPSVYRCVNMKTRNHYKSTKQSLLSQCGTLVREQLQRINQLYGEFKKKQPNLLTMKTFEENSTLSRVLCMFELLASRSIRPRCEFCCSGHNKFPNNDNNVSLPASSSNITASSSSSSCNCDTFEVNEIESQGEMFDYIWRTCGPFPLDEKVFGTPLNDLETPIKHLADLPGVTSCYDYIGIALSIFASHFEDLFGVNSINFNYLGAPKIWFCVHPKYYNHLNRKFYEYMCTISPKNRHTKCKIKHKEYFIDPELLQAWGIPYTVLIQEPGTLVVTKNNCFHEGFNLDFNYCRAVNVILSDFVTTFSDAEYDWECNCTDSINRTSYQRVRRTKENGFDQFLRTMLNENEFPIQIQPFYGSEKDWKRVSKLLYTSIARKEQLKNYELSTSNVHNELSKSINRLNTLFLNLNITQSLKETYEASSPHDQQQDTIDKIKFLSEHLRRLTLDLEVVNEAPAEPMETEDYQTATLNDTQEFDCGNSTTNLHQQDLPSNYMDSSWSNSDMDDELREGVFQNSPSTAKPAYIPHNQKLSYQQPQSVQNITVNVPTGNQGAIPCVINITNNTPISNPPPPPSPSSFSASFNPVEKVSSAKRVQNTYIMCQYCKKGFAGKYAFGKHLLQKHKIYMYKCETCPDFGTFIERDMGKHMQNIHNKVPNSYAFKIDSFGHFVNCK